MVWKLNFKKDFKSHLLYIIFHIRTYPFKHRKYEDGDFIPIKLEYLRNLITYNKAKYFLDLLVKEGVLLCDNKYEVGIKSKGYKISEKYKKQKFYWEEMENKVLASKIEKILKLVNQSYVP